MKILVDIQPSQSRSWGPGRYSLSLLGAILDSNKKHDFHLLMNGAFLGSVPRLRHHFSKWIPLSRTHVFFPVGDVRESDSRNAWRHQASVMIRQALIDSIAPDCVLLLNLFEGFADSSVVSIPMERNIPVVCVLYEVAPSAPDERTGNFRGFQRRKMEELTNADGLLAVSPYTADEAVELLGFDRKKIAVIGAGCELGPEKSQEANEYLLKSRIGISKKFVLCDSERYDPNNYAGKVLLAWGKLPRSLRDEYQLVVAGRTGNPDGIKRLASKAGLAEGEIRPVGHLDGKELATLYRATTLLIFPHLGDGFVLPVLEAMACGASFLSPDPIGIGKMRVNPEGLFDPRDVDQIAQLLRRCLEQGDLRSRLKAASMEAALGLTWKNAAAESLAYLDTLEGLFKREGQGPTTAASIDLKRVVDDLTRISCRSASPDLADYAAAAASLAALVPRPGRPCLYLDISQLAGSDVQTGIPRVVRAMLTKLPNLVGDRYDIVPVYGDGSGRFKKASRWLASQPNYQGMHAQGSDDVIDARNGDILLGLDLSAHLYPAYEPEIARLGAIGVRLYFVVYDLIPLSHPGYFEDGLVQAFNSWIHSTAQHADAFFCISKAVSQELTAWIAVNYPERKESLRIAWFHLGADISSSTPSRGMPSEASEILARMRANPSFLMVGTIEPRKGHALVLDEFESLWSERIAVNLVFAGKPGWKMEGLARRIAEHPERNKRLFWLDNASDEYLDHAYAASTSLIAASSAEGFGLPLIEAAQKGLSVIARDIPVFREVAGDGAIYFDGNRAGSLGEVVKNTLRSGKRTAVSTRIPWLTWEESARSLCSLILS